MTRAWSCEPERGGKGLVKWDSLRSAANGRIQLAYGDVLTTNTSQGSTVSEHIFAVPGGSRQVNAFGAYTSGSRHREQSFIVTSDGAERQEVAGRRPLGDLRQVREGDVIENVARNFARQPIKEGSLAMLARAENLRTGTIRMMQAGKQRLEQRAVMGKARSTLAATFQGKRDDATARRLQPVSENTTAERRDLLQRIRDIGPQVREAMRAAMERVQAHRERRRHRRPPPWTADVANGGGPRKGGRRVSSRQAGVSPHSTPARGAAPRSAPFLRASPPPVRSVTFVTATLVSDRSARATLRQ